MIESTNKTQLIKWIVLIVDLCIYVLIVHSYKFIFPNNTPHSIFFHTAIACAVGVLCLTLMSLVIPTVVQSRVFNTGRMLMRNLLVSVLTQGSFAALWHFMIVNHEHEMAYTLCVTCMLFCSLVCVRLIEVSILAHVRKSGMNTRSVLFVGNNPATINIYNEIMSIPTTGYRIMGYYSTGDIYDVVTDIEKLGSLDDFMNIVREDKPCSAEEIYCSLSHDHQATVIELIRYCDRHCIRFFYVPRIFTDIQFLLRPERIENTIIYTNRLEPLTSISNRIAKRLFDIIFSAIVLVCLLPFLPIIALIIKIQSPGPLFFNQQRTGMNGRTFYCHKFRSMRINKDADKKQATKHDDRIFPFGRFMRKTNIDELPQFWNVLCGEMSIVGPRPHMLLHTKQYSALIEKYMVRHMAKPGITGLAQISGYRGETEELWQMEGRVKKDIEYIEKWSLWLDITIICKTALSMIITDEHAY